MKMTHLESYVLILLLLMLLGISLKRNSHEVCSFLINFQDLSLLIYGNQVTVRVKVNI